MGERRFFTANDAVHDQLAIGEEEFHHMVHVMRFRRGDELEIINGRAFRCRCFEE